MLPVHSSLNVQISSLYFSNLRTEQSFYSCSMTMSGAIELFLKQSLNANGLPFSVTERTAADFDTIAE